MCSHLGEVVKAWEIGVGTMKRNEVAVFYCKPSYAYGKEGKLPKIPPDSVLIYEIELISWRGIIILTLYIIYK
jgi:FKBP-type peptidyl-prolyl cis-trans isomerase